MRSRQLISFRILSTSLFALIVLAGGSTTPAQESARDRAAALRGHLSQVESTYADSLAAESTGQSATIKVDLLRLDLRTKLEALLRSSTSSEAALAVYRADAEATLDAITAYEKALGGSAGEETTFMNVLSEQELGRMRGLLRGRLEVLKLERLNQPQLSTALEFRIREVDGWVRSLDLEAVRRARSGQIILKSIRGEVLAEDARFKYPAIGKADGIGREPNFKQKLALQVNLRSHNAPEDASLAVLRDEISKITPPSMPPPNARGPPASIDEALNRLRSAQFEELTAVTRRDAVRIAKARADLTMNREWLRLARQNAPATGEYGLSATSTEELSYLREGWQKWYAELIVEQQSPPGNASVDLEINQAKNQITELDAIIERRLLTPPPDGGDFGVGSAGKPLPPPGSETRAFARTWDRQLAHNELTELAKLSNQKAPVPSLEISDAAAKAFRTRIAAEATSIRDAYNETLQLQRKVLISGRGQAATESGRQIRQAQRLIRSSAENLRISLGDPVFANDPEIIKVVKSLSEIPPTKTGGGSDSLGRGLNVLENAREAAEVAVQPPTIEIQAVADSKAAADAASRIRLPPMPAEEVSNPLIKRPADYKSLYHRRQTLIEILKDPKRAPGGVIVDATLPAPLADRVKKLEVETSSGSVKVLLDGLWRTVKLRPDPLLARLAWAFVSDEQIAVIDLRPLQNTEALWLFLQYGDGKLPPNERDQAVGQLAQLTSVNVNDALRDTSLVPHLIAADQLMFDLLPRSAFAIQGEDERYGLPLKELRLAFRADAAAELNRANWQDVLFSKSILTVSQIDYAEGPQLVLSPKLSFNLFGVPARGAEVIPLSASERWFAANEAKLKALDQLAPLCEFAALVALFRTVNQRHIPNNLDDLIAVTAPAFSAPRFIVRRDRAGLQWQKLQSSLSRREP
jgi:hypothetical protein